MANDNTLEISEIFYSIQGESTFAGLPCVFIRLSGCNLQCSYCDSRYAIEEQGKTLKVDDIIAEVAAYPEAVVEITGGEPLLQKEVFLLIERLLASGRQVLVETNGSLSISALPIEATVIMDIKCPGSGSTMLHPDNITEIRRRAGLRAGAAEIKFVLTGSNDYIWAKEMILQNDLSHIAPVLLSPAESLFSARDLAKAILEDKLQVRLQLQLHKIIWPDISRGV